MYSFLELKINLVNNIWPIGVYDKRLDFNFKVSNLTSFHRLAIKFYKICCFCNLLMLKKFAKTSLLIY